MRVHLELDRDEKDLFAEAAALMGTTMSGFVRTAAKEKARALIEQQRLDTGIHDCAGIDCGVPAVNDYPRKFASQHRRRGVSQTFVLVDDSAPRSCTWRFDFGARAPRCGANALGLAALRKVAMSMRRTVP